MDAIRPTVLAYGSDECKQALEELTALYDGFYRDVATWDAETLISLREEKDEAFEKFDWDTATARSERENEVVSSINEKFQYDKAGLKKLAQRVVDVTAANIRAT